MPVTRRQSGRLPPPIRRTLQVVSVIDADTTDGTESSVTDLEHEDEDESASDWDGGRVQRKQPEKKRAKVTSPNLKKSPKQKYVAALTILPTMSLDILFEIFCLLNPATLLNLARTSKAFRDTLMTRKAITVWKHAWVYNSDGAPACPPDMSEPRWANLLFGGTKCQECGASSIQKIDFALRRRVCSSCLKKNLVYSVSFPKRFPDFDTAILELIPHTNVGGWSHGHASASKFYWEADIYPMAQEFGQYQRNVHIHKPGAKDALKKFRESRMKFVEDVLEHAEVCNEWINNIYESCRQDAEARKCVRYDAIVRRFKDLGYEATDISDIKYLPQVNVDRELTSRTWARIQPQLEPHVQRTKQRRVARERAALLHERRKMVKQVYGSYKKTLVPMQWIYLPTLEEIYLMPDFADLINSATAEPLRVETCTGALRALPGYLTTRADRLRQEMLAMLPAENGKEEGEVLEFSSSETDPVFLAKSVFICTSASCKSNRVLISWSGVMSHDCLIASRTSYSYMSTYHVDPAFKGLEFGFSERGAAAVSALVSLLEPKRQLDEISSKDLDDLDPRFVCMNCPIAKARGVHGRLAMSWRQCVLHHVERKDETHVLSQWMILPKDDEQRLKRQEGGDPSYNSLHWSCNHCPTHLDNLQRRNAAIEHVKKMHAEAQPRENKDFFHVKPSQRTGPLPQGLAMGPGASKDFRCLICSKNSRTFIESGVKAHLKDKHQIITPVQNEHYSKS
ncbi:hypothetical protein SCP_0703600 [Sparassis crispa]|uniref:F-box domain-containing protein n=1 Tax=Sparassis crispa TaxID=139825 RepID=A0A401GTW4_9APHY|nr:hypothetical protein SCP_0703600 [Sparassis crispa]GBE85174.1 hypothetical protein SCP_0703600 [Sparassis crispa]